MQHVCKDFDEINFCINHMCITLVREEDLELLDVLQQLEENNDEDKIDLDSSLAPLSQAHKNCK